MKWEFSLTPETFVVYSYKYDHDDGRVSYPLCFIFSSPVGKNTTKTKICPENLQPVADRLNTSLTYTWIMFIFLLGCKPVQQMMYAGSKNKLVQTVNMTKVSKPYLHASLLLSQPGQVLCCAPFLLLYSHIENIQNN